jgi:prolyl 4-hydroxylase
LLRIDEAYLRGRDKGEIPERDDYLSTLAEDLQLVNYKHRQEYTSHHDFGYSRIDRGAQGARYATLLLYLNEGMTGGETSFPRWVNAETFRELKVVPEAGKAILFYSQLPDGNLDDFSQHAALPVTDGEKWVSLGLSSSFLRSPVLALTLFFATQLINLWVWDPVYN